MFAIKRYSISIGLLFIVSFAGAACGILDSDDDNERKRTYPEAMELELTTVTKLTKEVTPPDSLNAEVYVNEVIKCPKDAFCIVPDGIIISDSLHADSLTEHIHLYVENPLQFREDEGYRLSLSIGTYPGNGEKRFELLGYTKLEFHTIHL